MLKTKEQLDAVASLLEKGAAEANWRGMLPEILKFLSNLVKSNLPDSRKESEHVENVQDNPCNVLLPVATSPQASKVVFHVKRRTETSKKGSPKHQLQMTGRRLKKQRLKGSPTLKLVNTLVAQELQGEQSLLVSKFSCADNLEEISPCHDAEAVIKITATGNLMAGSHVLEVLVGCSENTELIAVSRLKAEVSLPAVIEGALIAAEQGASKLVPCGIAEEPCMGRSLGQAADKYSANSAEGHAGKQPSDLVEEATDCSVRSQAQVAAGLHAVCHSEQPGQIWQENLDGGRPAKALTASEEDVSWNVNGEIMAGSVAATVAVVKHLAEDLTEKQEGVAISCKVESAELAVSEKVLVTKLAEMSETPEAPGLKLADLNANKQIEHSLLQRLLAQTSGRKADGQGGQCQVFKVYDEHAFGKRPVALRKPSPQYLDKVCFSQRHSHDYYDKLFEREVRVLEHLADLPNVVTMLFYDLQSKVIIFEWIAGPNLAQHLQETLSRPNDKLTGRAPISWSTQSRCDTVLQLLDAVEQLGNRGVVHGDLKDQNIMLLRENGKCKPILIDFSTALWLDPSSSMSSSYTTAFALVSEGDLVWTDGWLPPDLRDMTSRKLVEGQSQQFRFNTDADLYQVFLAALLVLTEPQVVMIPKRNEASANCVMLTHSVTHVVLQEDLHEFVDQRLLEQDSKRWIFQLPPRVSNSALLSTQKLVHLVTIITAKLAATQHILANSKAQTPIHPSIASELLLIAINDSEQANDLASKLTKALNILIAGCCVTSSCRAVYCKPLIKVLRKVCKGLPRS